jgi:hypothetical protein
MSQDFFNASYSYVDERAKLIEPFKDVFKVPFWGVDDVVKVAAFIAWHEPNSLWGGVKRDEAFDAFCRLIGANDPDRIFKIVRKDEDD